MRKYQNLLAKLLFASALATVAVGALMEGAPYPEKTDVKGEASPTADRLEAGARRIANGVYAVLAESPKRAEVEANEGRRVVLVYDRKYAQADEDRPELYVALDASSFVPLLLAGPPDVARDNRGWTLLDVRLAPQQVK